jgi:hypothetical protein
MYLIIQNFQVIYFLTFSTLFLWKHFSVTLTNSSRLYLEITIFLTHFLWCSEIAIQFIFVWIISFIFHFNGNSIFRSYSCIQDIILFFPNYSLFISVFQNIFFIIKIYFSLCISLCISLYISVYVCIHIHIFHYCITYIHMYIHINISNFISLICGHFYYFSRLIWSGKYVSIFAVFIVAVNFNKILHFPVNPLKDNVE